MHWYPPVNSIENKTGKPEINYEGYYKELNNLISGLMQTKKYVVILWERSVISDEDIANITNNFTVLQRDVTSELFIGNTLDEIRLKLVKEDMDFNDVDAFLLTGSRKPLAVYLEELKHVGSPNHLVIVYNHQTPSLQYDACREVNDANREVEISVKSLNLNLNDEKIIRNHKRFLKEEYPEIPNKTLQEFYFPKKFIELHTDEGVFSYEYLFLNKDIKFLPKIKREYEQLLESSESSLFTLIRSQIGKHEEIGKLANYTVRAYCYPQAMFVYQNELGAGKHNYRILNVDYENKKVFVEKLSAHYTVTYKISKYDINEELQEDVSASEELSVFNGNIKVNKKYCKISETIFGTKQTNNFHEYQQNDYENPLTTFQDELLPVVKLKINTHIIEELLNRDKKKTDDKNDTEWKATVGSFAKKVLHSLAHLLFESIKTKHSFSTDEIKLEIKTSGNDESEQSVNLYFIDLTGMNESFLNQFMQSDSINELFKIAEQILLQCPCNKGSKACIQIDYCNIPHCIDNVQLNHIHHDKLNVLRLVEFLLNREQEDIDLYLRYKTIEKIWDINKTGISYDHNHKMNELESFAKLIMEKKGGISFAGDYYDSSFLLIGEFSKTSPTDGPPTLGICRSASKQIMYAPGLPEIMLYETIFHERFHNYSRIEEKGERNLHPDLEYFNWDNIDDQKNIPYIGLLVVEGSASWFSLRMMEYFAAIDYIQDVSKTYILEYLTGLRLLLMIEREYGYNETINLLKSGFDITKYKNVYQTEIQQQLYEHLNSSDSSNNNKTPDWLRCLKNSDNTTSTNRVSYYLRAIRDQSKAMEGLNVYAGNKRPDKELRHIEERDIRSLAIMPSAEFTDDPIIVSVLGSIGLSPGDAPDDALLCERCASRDVCNLFIACMINGGRRIFNNILIRKFPKKK